MARNTLKARKVGMVSCEFSEIQPDSLLKRKAAPPRFSAANKHLKGSLAMVRPMSFMRSVKIASNAGASDPAQWCGTKFLIIDQKSMLGFKTLGMIDARLCQLVPTASHLLYCTSHSGLSIDNWNFLNTCTESALSAKEKDSFKDASCLFTTHNNVEAVNLPQLKALNAPCARIQVQHEGGTGRHKIRSDKAGGLGNHVFLPKGAKVMLIAHSKSLVQQRFDLHVSENYGQLFTGLVNATVSTIEDVIWAAGANQSDDPLVVLVSCEGSTGPTRWKMAANIPIVPIPAVKKNHIRAWREEHVAHANPAWPGMGDYCPQVSSINTKKGLPGFRQEGVCEQFDLRHASTRQEHHVVGNWIMLKFRDLRVKLRC
ncbi:hypothetical protein C8F01DRAFT_1313029 [Mycena amicta]|nr:hypothetical protein C8F01DRAFT_1313029 [Mycena amicta]